MSNSSIIRQLFCFAIRLTMVPYVIREIIQRNKVTILMFHEVDPQAFDRHIRVLKARYNIISLKSFLETSDLPPKPLIITLDDGHLSNYQLLPVIQKHRIPVTIFVCSGILGTNRHFWFDTGLPYEELEQLKHLDNDERLRRMEGIGFNETREYPDRQALSDDELLEMMEYVDFQAHTVFHPILPMCSDDRSRYEICQCKQDLESSYGLSVYALSYPNGDYSEREKKFAKDSGYRCAVTVDYEFNTAKTDPFELKRIYVGGNAGKDELITKASGLWIPFHKAKKMLMKRTAKQHTCLRGEIN